MVGQACGVLTEGHCAACLYHDTTTMPDYRRAWHPGGTNPIKHGLVKRVADWPYSTFHRLVKEGVYPKDWAGGEETGMDYSG